MAGGTTCDFILGLRAGDIPPDVARHAKRFLLDLIGVAAAGSRLQVSRIIRNTAVTLFAAGQEGAPFLFDGRLASPAGAALANATTIDGFDAHDGHPLTKGHAGCGALAGLLAFAGPGEKLDGAEALARLVVGYEVAIRAGIALHATACDYHTSGAWGALGVAAIGARSMRLDPAATREALGIAEYNGPRSQMMRCIDYPTMVKDGSGWGAMAGVVAAFLARDGFTGAPAVTVEGEEVRGLWADLGVRWRLSEQYMKPYPVCRWAQPAIEAAAQLQRDHGVAADTVRSIHVRTFREASKLAVRAPATTEQAQYSLPFPVAALLSRGRLGAGEIEGAGLRDEAVLSLAQRVELVEDPRFSSRFPAERWAVVKLILADGDVLVSQPAVARGSAENPLSDEEVSGKFNSLLQESGFGARAAPIEELVLSLESLPDARTLFAELSRP
ncbi:MAG: MmgE/PrpD family protein [Mesorhizobium sp.]